MGSATFGVIRFDGLFKRNDCNESIFKETKSKRNKRGVQNQSVSNQQNIIKRYFLVKLMVFHIFHSESFETFLKFTHIFNFTLNLLRHRTNYHL